MNSSPLIFLKRRQTLNEIFNSEGVFQIQFPIYSVNFSNNMLIPQVKINWSKTTFLFL